MSVKKTRNHDNNVVINDAIEVITDPEVEIEPVVTKEFDQAVSEEAFMNEVLEIEIHESTNENDPNHVIVSVNDKSQPIFRGRPTKVKRKYVEVLARCRESKYTQVTPNPMEPDQMEMRERSALTYPFTVLSDPNPKGRAWLAAVKAEA
jgi:hypothetical protein